MGIVTVGTENSTSIDLYYEDHGSGPVVFCCTGGRWTAAPGSRSCTRCWRPDPGHHLRPARVRPLEPTRGRLRLRHPRRRPRRVLTELDVRGATLIGFSLGTGEQARYVGKVRHRPAPGLVIIESLAPSFAKSADNPTGVDAGRGRACPAGDPRRPVRVADRAGRRLPQPRRLSRQAGQRRDRPGHLGRRRRCVGVRDLGLPAGWLDDFSADIGASTSHAHPARHRRPHPADRRAGPAPARGATRAPLRRDRGRPARHVRHPRRRGQPRTARFLGQSAPTASNS
jgi:hypothetical protein